MSKKTIISDVNYCNACPHGAYVTTTDSAYPRIYIGCGKIKREFSYGRFLPDIPIPDWCPMPDPPQVLFAEMEAKAA